MYLVELPQDFLIEGDGYLIGFYIQFIAQGLSAPTCPILPFKKTLEFVGQYV
jgi:hypothetical protein